MNLSRASAYSSKPKYFEKKSNIIIINGNNIAEIDIEKINIELFCIAFWNAIPSATVPVIICGSSVRVAIIPPGRGCVKRCLDSALRNQNIPSKTTEKYIKGE